MSDPDDDVALRELAGLMRAGGLQRLRELLEREPVLSEIADCQRLLDESVAANERPRPRLASVNDDGSIVMLVACPRRLQTRANGEIAPSCRWLPIPVETVHGYECKTCGRPELGGDRVEVLDKLFGRSPA